MIDVINTALLTSSLKVYSLWTNITALLNSTMVVKEDHNQLPFLNVGADAADGDGGNNNVDITCTIGQKTCLPGLRILHEHGFSGQDNIFMIIRELFVGSKESYARGWRAVQEFHHTGDVSALAVATLLPIPAMKVFHILYYKYLIATNKVISLIRRNSFSNNHQFQVVKFKESRFYKIGLFISQGGQIASLIYIIELLTAFILNVLVNPGSSSTAVPKHLIPLQKFPGLFGNIVYGYWFAGYATQIKTNLMKSSIQRLPDPGMFPLSFSFPSFFAVTFSFDCITLTAVLSNLSTKPTYLLQKLMID